MADAARSERPRSTRPRLGLAETWRRLNVEQRAAAVGALLLVVSTLGPFTFVEGAIVLVGASVLLLLRRRAEGREFHIPFGDGAVIAAAGAWAGVLILIRLFSRPLGQGLLALVCAAILIVAGLRERAKRPADDLPPKRPGDDPSDRPAADEPFADLPPRTEPVADRSLYRDETLPLRAERDEPPIAEPPGAEEPAGQEPAEAEEPAEIEQPDAEAPTAEDHARAEGPTADDQASTPRLPRPAKVLPPPTSEEDLEQPPLWDDPTRRE